MDRNILISVENRVARIIGKPKIICGNCDYTITFTFDDEWENIEVKTLRVSYNGTYSDHVFTGNTVELPPIIKAYEVYIGVFAGEITSTKAIISAEPSILCAGGSVADPEPDVYRQIVGMIKDGLIKGETGEPGPAGPTGPQGVPGKDGAPGKDGKDGIDGRDGVDATPYTLPTASADVKGGVMVGNGLQMDGDVLEVVPEGEWERIETFTLNEDATVIERTAYPDGTPYNLSAAKIKAQFFYPITAQIGTAMEFLCGKTLLSSLVVNVVAHDTGRPTHKSTALYQAKPVGGFYEFICSTGTQGSPMEPAYASNGDYQFVSTKQKIDCIKYKAWKNIFPAGSYIEIWGVRANA